MVTTRTIRNKHSNRLPVVYGIIAVSASVCMSQEPMIYPVESIGKADAKQPAQKLEYYSKVGMGQYAPLPLADYKDAYTERFETSFEECAPGRNSGSNEWSAFGVMGDRDFNNMGRDLRIRYPLYDLVFRMIDKDREIKPDQLSSFRLGLVNNQLPAICAGWMHENLLYKVSVMTVPDKKLGNYDLYRLDIQNPTQNPLPSKLIAGIDGPPDMHLKDGIVYGIKGAPFIIVDPPHNHATSLRDWGLCDKRAKSYGRQPAPGQPAKPLDCFRVGLDGLPIVYRAKVEPKKKYAVYMVSPLGLGGTANSFFHVIENPQKPGDLIFEYKVEGAETQTLDAVEYMQARPKHHFCVLCDGAHDVDGDGYIEITAGVAKQSRYKHSRLAAVYILPEGFKTPKTENVYDGTIDKQCIRIINVGVTPEQDWYNQYYDQSDVGIARMNLIYSENVQAGHTKTYWLKVPPIYRREPVSMVFMSHAFRDVLPGEAVPPYSTELLRELKSAAPIAAQRQVTEYWETYHNNTTEFDVPDRIMNDMYRSRMATRAIHNVSLNKDVMFNMCSPFNYFDHAYRDACYGIIARDMFGYHAEAEKLLKVYCMEVKDVPKGPIAFRGEPLQLGMLENGQWYTRPGQHDTQGQNLWALVEHYKLSGNRQWLEQTAYPYIRRGALWIVDSRENHKKQVKDSNDPRYGLIEPGAMEVHTVGQGVHMYYLNIFAVLGLKEAADAAQALGKTDDRDLFTKQWRELRNSLLKSFKQTFRRLGLYEGHLWFGVEEQGVGMYGFWAHNALLWPCRAIDPHDPMLTATYRRMERMNNAWGGGIHSEGQSSRWPYIGVDLAISNILRGEPDKTLDYFCAYTDTAGGTLSWGEGYTGTIAAGDQPHNWADYYWLLLFRHLFVMEDEDTLLVTPALFRRWHQGNNHIAARGLPTYFGDLDLEIRPSSDGSTIDYQLSITPKGDQDKRPLRKVVLYPRTATGCSLKEVRINGQATDHFNRNAVILASPQRNQSIKIQVDVDQH